MKRFQFLSLILGLTSFTNGFPWTELHWQFVELIWFLFQMCLLYCFFVSLLGIFWGGLKFFNNISKLRTKGFLKDIVALINPTFQFIYMHGYTMGRHILIENIWFLLLQVNSEMIRENLERIVGSDDSTFSGLDLATLIRNKYGRSYDVLLIKKVWFSICDAYL